MNCSSTLWKTLAGWLIAGSVGIPVCQSQEPVESPTDGNIVDQIDFGRDVQPIFVEHCHSCHGPTAQESNFRLDLRNNALAAGDFGDPSIVPGNSNDSRLIDAVSGIDKGFVMPPDGAGEPLSEIQITTLRRWIDNGAVWPDEWAGSADLKLTTSHWSFRPIADPAPPEIEASWASHFPIRNGIDQFIAGQMIASGLRPSVPADRITRLRRVYLDMLGLQPSPEQVRDFVANDSPFAYERLIEEVLASPHYGERWARHWLDVVRFGESTGYEVNRDRSNGWYYRDYVIDALNSDKSYRDFIVEQLAGDVVGVDDATGFLVGGPNDIVKSPDINLTLMQRQDELADYINTTSTTFLGLTVGCARCHDHKFDPILQKDYYSLQAVFAGVEHGERELTSHIGMELHSSIESAQVELATNEKLLDALRSTAGPPAESDPNLFPMVNGALNADEFEPTEARFLRFTIHKTNQGEPCIDELEVFAAESNTNVAIGSAGGSATSSGNYANDPKHKLEHVNDGQYGNEHSWICDTTEGGWVQIEFPEPKLINRVVWARDRQNNYADRLAIHYTIAVSRNGTDWNEVSSSSLRRPFLKDGKEAEDAFIARLPDEKSQQASLLFKSVNELRSSITQLKKSVPVGYVGTFKTPDPTFRLYRGDPLAPREEVAPDVLTVMGTLGLEKDAPEQSRRLKLAEWIASADNPLTARVIVNRVWHYHFGRGIVSTPSDLGKNGGVPSHPELLDWLATRFMENGWSLKWLHREILLSSTYQQVSRPRTDAIAVDADCRLLWRFPPRRLEAEAIRDCVLQLTGKLNSQTGGPGFLLFKVDRENVHHYFPLEKFEAEHFRRMIYMTKIRQEQDEVFGMFDCPDGGQTIPQRSRSTTALQALNLLNSKFMNEQAGFLADRLKTLAGEKPEDQVRTAFDLAFARPPTTEELQDSVQFIDAQGLEAFCRALLNANEFLFLS